ncbi:MAG: aminotransferase class I/II-fold pyridoxal phosphate-dependent enzyme [Lachnospiraceae bacterium]|nr:aminotransferase class I/II-fold pyridoxal phosphate-dependent enzyme [Lachnospiraceae bacterium]
MASWRDNVRRVTPYTPGEQPHVAGMIKLNTNEDPYPPAPEVIKALQEVPAGDLRLYPDPAASDLVNAIAAYHGVSPDQVFVGVGSDDVLAVAFMTFFNSGKPIFFPDITYSFYPVWAELFRIPYETKALGEIFEIRPEDYAGGNGGVVFPNPNAPTSRLENLDTVENILQNNPESAVIVDEAYIDFAGNGKDSGVFSALSLLNKYENLLVVRTFSKSRSLAGMRIGYAIGSAEMIKAMSDDRYSFNSYTMNRTAIAAGTAAIGNEEYFRSCIAKVIATRERAKAEFTALGFTYPEPSGNFIFVSHPACPAKELFSALRSRHIYVRYFDVPRIDNCLRVTIGTDEQMEALFDFLKEYMA